MACRYEISVLASNETSQLWAIAVSAWGELLYLHTPMY